MLLLHKLRRPTGVLATFRVVLKILEHLAGTWEGPQGTGVPQDQAPLLWDGGMVTGVKSGRGAPTLCPALVLMKEKVKEEQY